MILSLTAFKGGVGKSTSAIHLAGALATDGAPVLLVDADPNRSATKWAARGAAEGTPLPFRVCDPMALSRHAAGATHIVFDTPARPSPEDLATLAETCDLVVVPVTPDALSLDAAEETAKGLRALGGAPHVALQTIVPPAPSRAGAEAASVLDALGVPMIAQRIRRLAVHQSAAAAGCLVRDVRAPRAADAWSDYVAACEQLTMLARPSTPVAP